MVECLSCKTVFSQRSIKHRYCSAYCQRRKSSLNYSRQLDFNPALSLDGEIWKDVVGYKGLYEVSNFGRLRSRGRHGVLSIRKIFIGDRGYYRRSLYDNGYKNFSIHRLVAMAFISNPDCKPYINHIDGNKLNNYASNLEWCTQAENLRHASKSGTLKLGGCNNPNASFTEQQVIEIRALYAKGGLSCAKIANMYGVTASPIKNMVARRTYRNI